eukprot:9568704-Alexandrium_andersonii.AAC.1
MCGLKSRLYASHAHRARSRSQFDDHFPAQPRLAIELTVSLRNPSLMNAFAMRCAAVMFVSPCPIFSIKHSAA